MHLKDWLQNRTESKLNGSLDWLDPKVLTRDYTGETASECTANKLDVFPLGLVKSLERRHRLLMRLSR